MNSTLEQRARDLWEKIDDVTLTSGEATGLIFLALRDAENRAHEMDAEWCDEVSGRALPAEFADVVDEKTMHLIAWNLAKHFRSFKHKDAA